MKPLFHCEFEYYKDIHLSQIYTGFFELQKKGVIELAIKQRTKSPTFIPLITVTVNKKIKIVYDVLDGLTWIPGGMKENLEYFKKKFNVDFYFKRSYHASMQEYKPGSCRVFPLGLNYPIAPDINMLSYNAGYKEKIKYLIKTNSVLKKIFKKKLVYASDYEFFPVKHEIDKILFITRLWDPAEAKTETSKHHREHINAVRVECIQRCKNEFGQNFTGGLIMNEFSNKNHKPLIMPSHLTNKFTYLEAVKQHSICIATTGLHDSIGWKMGEYVASSRAIVSEPLHFELPGNFSRDNNYLEFRDPDHLVNQLNVLISNKSMILKMMENNFYYYNNYLKPENLIFNTLLTLMGNT